MRSALLEASISYALCIILSCIILSVEYVTSELHIVSFVRSCKINVLFVILVRAQLTRGLVSDANLFNNDAQML